MPNISNKFIKDRDIKDIRILLDKILDHVHLNGLDSFDSVNRELIKNILSYRKKLNSISQEQINVLWTSVDYITKELFHKESSDVIDTENITVQIDEEKFLIGKFWIFPGPKPKYIKCESHFKFAKDNPEIFIENLKIDSLDYFKQNNSKGLSLISLILRHGGIIADFVYEDNKKVGVFQLCQCSMFWLKNKLIKMPILKSHIHVFDANDEYNSVKDGIYFIIKR